MVRSIAAAAFLTFALSILAFDGPPAYGLPNQVEYAIEAELDTEQNIIVGRETVLFTNRTGEPLEKLHFHIYPNAFKRGSGSHYLEDLREVAGIENTDVIYADPQDDAFVDIVSVERDHRPLEFSVQDTLLTVKLDEPLESDAQMSLLIAFIYDLMEVPPRGRRAASLAIRSGHRNGVYTLALWYPKLAVYDHTGWNLEPYGYLGEFYGDFARYTVQLTVPADHVVAATGQLKSELTEIGNAVKRRLRFVARRAHDFAWVSSPRYRVQERHWKGKTVRALVLNRGDLAERALSALQYFSDMYGDYAYSTLSVAQVEAGGGMEYPGIVMIGDGSTREVAHEVAHQWWYAAVGNDEFDEAWLDEGFATFAEERYRIEALDLPPQGARRSLQFREPGEPVLQPASEFSSLSSYVAAVYTKGSGILWMLRGLLGHETYNEVLQRYYREFQYRNATTEGFIRVAEAVSGRELAWFFDQWLRTAKRLDLAIQEVRSIPRNGEYEHAALVRREGAAVMPTAIAFTLSNGQSKTVDWDGRAREASLKLTGGSPVERVIIDPEQSLLEENRENNAWNGAPPARSAALPLWITAVILALALVGRCFSDGVERSRANEGH